MKQIAGSFHKYIKRFRWSAALFIFLFSVFGGIILSSPHFAQTAYAAGEEEYAFNYNPADEDAINADMGDYAGDDNAKKRNSIYQKTAVYAKGGAFSDGQPPRLAPEEDYNRGGGVYMYRGTFNCQGYSIGFFVLLALEKPIGDKNPKGDVYYYSIKGNGTNVTSGPLSDGGPISGNNAKWIDESTVIKELPGICRVANYAKPNAITAINIPKNFREGGINSWKNDSSPNKPGSGSGATSGSSGSSVDEESQLGCDFEFDNALTWVICPVVDMMSEAVSKLDAIITSQLTIESDQIFCNGSTCDAYKSAWTAFRNIALGLMVIAGLLVLIAQALGMEILDAYTIRKVLPNLLIVAIGITLSWPIMKFLVEMTNALGHGVSYMILAPFSKLDNDLDLTIGDGVGNLLGSLGIGGAGFVTGVGIWIALGGIGVLLSYLATALLAVVIALLVLVLREVIIIGLVLAAPIFIVAYILPNTQKLYKFWWDVFFKALLMFPLIAAFIAVGRVFSAISIQNTGGIAGVNQLIAFVAYFAPYFLIPLTFKFAGGAIRQIGGFVNDRSRGGFDALRGYRTNQRKQRIQAARTGGLYRDDFGKFGKKGRSISGMANKIGNWTVDFDEQARVTAGERGGAVGRALFGRYAGIAKEEIAESTMEQSQKAAQKLNAHYSTGRAIAGLHDYALSEVDDGTDAGRARAAQMRQQLNELVGVRDENGNFTGTWRAIDGKNEAEAMAQIYAQGGKGARLAATELESKAGIIGSFKGSGKDETQRADLETVGLMTAAAAGRLENEEIAKSRTTGLGDFGGFGTTRMAKLQDMASQKRTEQSRGHGIEMVMNAAGELQAHDVYQDPTSKAAQDSFMRINAQELGSGKSEAVDALANTMMYAASEYEMEMGKGGTLQFIKDAEGNKVRKTDQVALDRAKAAQERIRYIASYSVGDTDVGRKVQNVATKLGMGDLSFGGRNLSPEQLALRPTPGDPLGGGTGAHGPDPPGGPGGPS